MKPTPPLVSVVVPSFNESPDIVRASLQSLREQTFTDFECIVIDESTRPELAAACQAACAIDSRFIYVHPTKRLGLSRSLNLGLDRARGELIARFDSDDLCLPDRLNLQVAYLRAHPAVSVVGGSLEIMDEDGRTEAFRHYPLEPKAVARGMHLTTTVAHPTIMFRRALVATHGSYNPAFRFSEDLDLWLRWMNAGVVFANIPQVVVRYRQKNTRRDTKHWRFNLRARVRNFAPQHLLRRLIGIGCIAVWTVLPMAIQEHAFRIMILRRQRRSPSA
ncbi:MAG: glycosyltransferase [Thermoleophilia bacterium]|nr:glycosyltransferase [Thermoleophilia bacterium]